MKISKNSILIKDKKIGDCAPCYIIAEAGVNHNGDLDLAIELVEIAAKVGVDAVKFQTFKAKDYISDMAPKADYMKETTGFEGNQVDLLTKLELSKEAHHKILKRCKNLGLEFISTPFETKSADFLSSLGMSVYKISSGDLTNIPFLDHVARKNLPIILSTGMASIGEVETALDVIHEAGAPPVVLLHCVSNYPAAPKDVNLRAMKTLAHAFGVPVGYSDHTQGNEISIAAVAMGACVIEKHFTIDRSLQGPDHQASSEPNELKELVEQIRCVESALGDGRKKPAENEINTALVARKSLIAAKDLRTGTILDKTCIEIKRPGTGIPPMLLSQVVGRTLRTNLTSGQPIAFSHLS